MTSLQEKLRAGRLVESLVRRTTNDPGDWRAVDLLLLALARAGEPARVAALAAEEIDRAATRPWDPARARWLCKIHTAARAAQERLA